MSVGGDPVGRLLAAELLLLGLGLETAPDDLHPTMNPQS
jgi:hypothetical protein